MPGDVQPAAGRGRHRDAPGHSRRNDDGRVHQDRILGRRERIIDGALEDTGHMDDHVQDAFGVHGLDLEVQAQPRLDLLVVLDGEELDAGSPDHHLNAIGCKVPLPIEGHGKQDRRFPGRVGQCLQVPSDGGVPDGGIEAHHLRDIPDHRRVGPQILVSAESHAREEDGIQADIVDRPGRDEHRVTDGAGCRFPWLLDFDRGWVAIGATTTGGTPCARTWRKDVLTVARAEQGQCG